MKKLLTFLSVLLFIGCLTGCTDTNKDTINNDSNEVVNSVDGGQGNDGTVTGDETSTDDGTVLTSAALALESALAGKETPAFMNLSETELLDITGITPEETSNFVFAMPMMNVHATTYVAIEAKDEAALESIKTKMEAYLKGVEETWSSYLPDQYDLVMNRVEKTEGNLYLMCIANDAVEVCDHMLTYLTTPTK